jgi:phosphoenolpyruvate phosphomutase
LLVHSKRFDAKEIYAFLSAFDKDVPLFIVPTKYYTVPVSELTRDPRVRGIIWANHNIRTCITAMQNTCAKIFKDGSIAGVEDEIASVSEIFRLQNQDEYLEMEKKYLPANPQLKAVILAAGSPGVLAIDKPKTLITISAAGAVSLGGKYPR